MIRRYIKILSILLFLLFFVVTGSWLVYAYPIGYRLPFVDTANITCGPGCYLHKDYGNVDTTAAIDFQALNRESFEVVAVASGIAYVDEVPDFGIVVRIDHGDGLQSFYAHLSRVSVTDGEQVWLAGQVIGYTGDTGSGGQGNHLHFEIRQNAGGKGWKNVYSGQAIKIDDHPQIDLEKRVAKSDGRAYFPPAPPPGELEAGIPSYALACDIPIGQWGTCYDPETGRTANCGFGINPETGQYPTGDEVCARSGKKCKFVTPDGGVACE